MCINLEELNLSGCNNIKIFGNYKKHNPNENNLIAIAKLKYLKLNNCNLLEVYSLWHDACNIEKLELKECPKLRLVHINSTNLTITFTQYSKY